MLRVIDVVNWTNKIGGTLIVLKTYQRKRKKSQNKKRENRYKKVHIRNFLNFRKIPSEICFFGNSVLVQNITGTHPNHGNRGRFD